MPKLYNIHQTYLKDGRLKYRAVFVSNIEIWEILKDPNTDLEYALGILNKRKSFPIQMKEYIIKRRPDLIGQIEVLPRKLRRKYKEELNLSGVEI